MMSVSNAALNQRLNSVVESFENSVVGNPSISVTDFFPNKSDHDYPEIALELLRVDWERNWNQGRTKQLREYRERFADVLASPDRFGKLAFEDYRLRLLGGESPALDEYERLGVSTKSWPVAIDEPAIETSDTFGSIAEFSDELNRLSEAVGMFPKAGETFAGMKIVRQIGRGAFGRVFLAKQEELSDRLIVLKISTNDYSESQRLAKLQHTNIVPVYSVHGADHLTAICMPYFGECTLADAITALRAKAKIPKNAADLLTTFVSENLSTELASQSYEQACLSILLQIATGLRHASSRGILHRDLKPANVLLANDGTALLLDFNVSDDVVAGGPVKLSMGGTLPYMSPEQVIAVRDGGNVDLRSDVYSFGILMYELLTLQHPFVDRHRETNKVDTTTDSQTKSYRPISSQLEDATHVRTQTVLPVHQINKAVSTGLSDIVTKCLQTEPEARYRSFEEICEDLEHQLRHQPLRHTPNRSVTERIRKWACRHPRLSSVSTIVPVFAVIVLITVMFGISQFRLYQRSYAKNAFLAVSQSYPLTRVFLSAYLTDEIAFQDGQSRAKQMLQRAGLEDDYRQYEKIVRYLDETERKQFASTLMETLFLLSAAELRLALSDPTHETAHRTAARDYIELATQLCGHDPLPMALQQQRQRLGSEVDDLPPHLNRNLPLVEIDPVMLNVMHQANEGNWDGVKSEFEKACRANPTSVANHLMLGRANAQLGFFDQAELQFSTSIVLAPDSIFGYFYRGRVRWQMQQFDDAAEDFSQVLRIRPSCFEALMNRALIYHRLKENRLAKDDLDRAIELSPGVLRAYFIRSRVLQALQDFEAAQQDKERGFQCKPVTVEDWLVQGSARLRDGDIDGAKADFEQARQCDPRSRSVMRSLCYLYDEHVRDDDQALKIISQLVQWYPHLVRDRMTQAVLLARIGKKQVAIKDVQTVLSKTRNGRFLFQAACVYAILCQEDEKYREIAIGYLAEAINDDMRWLERARTDRDLKNVRDSVEFRLLVGASRVLEKSIRKANN